MPIPKPHKGEKKQDFISRCMGDGVMNKEYDQKQRAAICYSQWKDVHGSEPDGRMGASGENATIEEFEANVQPRKASPRGERPTAEGRGAEPKSNFAVRAGLAETVARTEMDFEVRNVVTRDLNPDGSVTASASEPFVNLGYNPDKWKAYMEFDIVHTLPAILGPVSEGFYCCWMPQTVAASHGSLQHQQVNLNHLLRAYASSPMDKIAKDRIVGCVVATYFPPEPFGGWKIGDDPNTAPCIRACAVIFKLADGVNRVFGDHQASRKKQSVSIEAVTTYNNLGIYLPSRGVNGIVPLMEAGDHPEIAAALSLEPLKLDPIKSGPDGQMEQGAFVYGLNGKPCEFRGVGITPRPAEREAKIISFDASRTLEENAQRPTPNAQRSMADVMTAPDGGTLVAMAAEKVDRELIGQTIEFKSRRIGIVRAVTTEGKAKIPVAKWGIEATAEDPVLDIEMADNRHVLKRMSEVAGQIRG
jgi:hypothetical protein